MRGTYDFRARRVLFAVQLQDRGEHRARYVTAHENFENVVITLFDFEQGTDANYHDCVTSDIYSAWMIYFEFSVVMHAQWIEPRSESQPPTARSKASFGRLQRCAREVAMLAGSLCTEPSAGRPGHVEALPV